MNRNPMSKKTQEQLAKLRALLENNKPDIVDKIHTPTPATPGSPEGEEQMLSMILSDALKGVDISTHYRAFFQKLQADPGLCNFFLEALTFLEESAQGNLEPLPQPPSRDLSFLKAPPLSKRIEQPAAGGWRITWIQAVAHLQHILFPQKPLSAPVLRSATDYFEDASFRLFQSNVELADTTITALLEARQPVKERYALYLSLYVAPNEDSGSTELPELRAHLDWGDYHASVSVDEHGQALFPVLSLDAVLADRDKQVRSNLQLTLETLH